MERAKKDLVKGTGLVVKGAINEGCPGHRGEGGEGGHRDMAHGHRHGHIDIDTSTWIWTWIWTWT